MGKKDVKQVIGDMINQDAKAEMEAIIIHDELADAAAAELEQPVERKSPGYPRGHRPGVPPNEKRQKKSFTDSRPLAEELIAGSGATKILNKLKGTPAQGLTFMRKMIHKTGSVILPVVIDVLTIVGATVVAVVVLNTIYKED